MKEKQMKAKIITMNDAKEMAQKVAGTTEEQQAQKMSIFEEIANSIQQVNPEMGGFEEIASLLSLPDEQFNIISPVFLDELEKSFSNSNDRLLMIQYMNAGNIKAEDLSSAYEEIVAQIDEQMKDSIPLNKRNFLKKMLGIVVNAVNESEGAARRTIEIPIVIEENAKMPTYARVGDAGLDIYAKEDITIGPGETVLLKTGIKTALPKGYEFQVRPKSGRSLKSKLRVANAPGTIKVA